MMNILVFKAEWEKRTVCREGNTRSQSQYYVLLRFICRCENALFMDWLNKYYGITVRKLYFIGLLKRAPELPCERKRTLLKLRHADI